jgi:hypothetical protein
MMLSRIEVEDHDEAGHRTEVTFFFDGNEEPFSAREFTPGTATRRWLDHIQDGIAMFNSMEERGEE